MKLRGDLVLPLKRVINYRMIVLGLSKIPRDVILFFFRDSHPVNFENFVEITFFLLDKNYSSLHKKNRFLKFLSKIVN